MTPIAIVAIVVVSVVAFAALWLSISALVAAVSGWRRIAAVFQPERDAHRRVPNESYRLQTVFVGLTRYKNCMHVRIFDDGIEIEPMVFFKFAHPPLFVPGRAIEHVVPVQRLLPGIEFRVDGRRIVLVGRSAGSRFWQQFAAAELRDLPGENLGQGLDQ